MSTMNALRLLKSRTKAEVFLVGGYVRDYLRSKKNEDLDVVVRGLTQKQIKDFLEKHGSVKEVKLAQTKESSALTIILFKAKNDQIEAQITLPRRGKRQIPDSKNTLRQDARFRDFRINCMYLPIDYTCKSDVIDFVGGKEDISKRRIKSNGSSVERIKESPIRMLRAISLAARTGYTIDKKLLRDIRNNAQLITKCPIEIVRNEFHKILMSRRPSRFLRLMHRTKLMQYVIPEVSNCFGIKQDGRYHKYDVFTHLLLTVDNSDYDLVLRLSGLLHDIGKPGTAKRIVAPNEPERVSFHKHEAVSTILTIKFLNRFKYDKDTSKKVINLVKNHMYHYTRDWTDSAVIKFMKRVNLTEDFLTEDRIKVFPLFKLRSAERLGNGLKTIPITDRQLDFEKRILEVYNKQTAFSIKDLDINGNVIMDTFKLNPGQHIGNILKFLLEKVQEVPELNNKVDLLKAVVEYLHDVK